jgi:hypothetical protein
MPEEFVTTRDLSPSSALPLAYYLFAHGCLLTVFLALLVEPSIAAGSFYQSRFAALVHLVTLGWITGSILGSFYIVAPLTLGIVMKVGMADWVTFLTYVIGSLGMGASLWTVRYDAVALFGSLPTLTLLWVAGRGGRGMRWSPAPPGVTLHVALAFVNILGAAALGIVVALDRSRGVLGLSPLAVTFAHAHIAGVGWATMMVVGLAYRLIPMMLPAAMPRGPRLAASAILIEAGLIVLVAALLLEEAWTAVGPALILAGLVSFAMQMRSAVSQRMPRPPALPPRDWSTWQAHAALLWLAGALIAGEALAFGVPSDVRLPLMWVYGVAGLLGFLGQIVAGIQGRLVPFYAWYRGFAALGRPPNRSANALPSAAFARSIFLAWTAGLLPLAAGLALEVSFLIRVGGACLGVAVLFGGTYMAHMMRAARRV